MFKKVLTSLCLAFGALSAQAYSFEAIYNVGDGSERFNVGFTGSVVDTGSGPAFGQFTIQTARFGVVDAFLDRPGRALVGFADRAVGTFAFNKELKASLLPTYAELALFVSNQRPYYDEERPATRDNPTPGFFYDGSAIFVSARDTTTITVSPIPEPETYAMLLVGLGVMATIAKRRRKSAVHS